MSVDPFEQAKKRMEERKKAESSPPPSYDYEEIEWMGIRSNTEDVFRIVGLPFDVRQNPSDPRAILYSKILNDEGKYSHLIWPIGNQDALKPDKKWIMMKIHERVMSGDRIESVNAEGKKEVTWKHHNVGMKCYEWVSKNKRENDRYNQQFYPSKKVLMNVIDRMDDWCVQNKSCKVLTSSKSPYTFKDASGKDITFFYIDYGIPNQLYNAIWDSVVEFRKSWETIDVIVKKRTMTDGGYVVRDAKEKDKLGEKAASVALEGPLTEQELAYKRFDLDKLFKVTSYSSIKKKFEQKIKLVDVELNTRFYEELLDLAAVEEKEREKEKAEKAKTTVSVSKEEQVATSTEAPKTEEPRRSRESRKPAQESSESVEDKLKKALPSWNSLNDEDVKEMLDAVEDVNADGSIVYKSGSDLLPCKEGCKKGEWHIPSKVYTCGKCGDSL